MCDGCSLQVNVLLYATGTKSIVKVQTILLGRTKTARQQSVLITDHWCRSHNVTVKNRPINRLAS